MKVSNMTGRSGNNVANQFIIEGENYILKLKDKEIIFDHCEIFQSYKSIIAIMGRDTEGKSHIILDSYYWDYSVTTGKYRNSFLRETKKETERNIKEGRYILTDLN